MHLFKCLISQYTKGLVKNKAASFQVYAFYLYSRDEPEQNSPDQNSKNLGLFLCFDPVLAHSGVLSEFCIAAFTLMCTYTIINNSHTSEAKRTAPICNVYTHHLEQQSRVFVCYSYYAAQRPDFKVNDRWEELLKSIYISCQCLQFRAK